MGNRKKKKVDDSKVDIGAIMTVSLFLILLTFFILLNSIAVLDDNKTRMAIGSLMGAFGRLPGGLSPMDSGGSILPPTAPLANEELTMEQFLSYMKNKSPGWAGEIKIESVGDAEKITINQNVLFTKDRFQLSQSILPFLDKLCRIINKGNYPVEIVGHTDNTPAKEKGGKSNWELSALMAIQLAKYLISKGTVSPKRLNAYGSSSYRPVASNATRQSRSRNERVEIILNMKAPAYIKRIFEKRPYGKFTYKNFDFRVF